MSQWPSALRIALNMLLNSPESLYLVWGPQRMFFFNDAYRPILGPRLEGAVGKTLAQLWPDAWEQVEGMIEDAMNGRACRFVDHPVTLVRAEQPEQTWWSFSFSPIHDEHAAIHGVICHTVETTRQVHTRQALEASEARTQQTLRALRDSEEFNRRVLASSNDCIKVLDLEGRLAFMSEGGQRVMEISDFNGIKGCPWPDFWKREGHQQARDAVASALAGEAARFQGMAQTLAGTSKWWDVQVTPMLDAQGRTEKILCISRDITATRNAEEELRGLNATLEQRVEASKRDHDRLWQLSTDLMLVAEFGGTMIAANPAWTQALGWKQHELVGRSLLELVHPDDWAPTAAAMSDLRGGMRFPHFENRYRHKDGSYHWLSWTAVPDEAFIHAVGRNVQAEREAAAVLRKTEEALRQSQKLEAIGQLTGGVAHDFNNLLTVVRSSVDLLRRSRDEKRQQRYVEAISDTVDRAAKLTGQLLAFARQQALRPEVFEVAAHVQSISEMLASLTGSRVGLEFQLPTQPCFVNADTGQFETALINIAANARDAMNGQGRLIISVNAVDELPALRSAPALKAPYIAIALSDSGSGIREDQLERVFEPFFTTKEVGKGTGLGLSQVFGFAKQSGGEVVVCSKEGQGTTFTLYLPRAANGPLQQRRSPERLPLLDGDGALILVVEDNPEVGEFTNQTLREMGYHTVWAKNAQEALSALAQPPGAFLAVFSDVVMPGMNGVELALEVARRYPSLPVVLTSGYSLALAQSESQGFTFLQKPYSVEALARILQRLQPQA